MDVDLILVDWLRQFSKDQTETFIRGCLVECFSQEKKHLKKHSVLSGGEKVRCMLSRMMLVRRKCINIG